MSFLCIYNLGVRRLGYFIIYIALEVGNMRGFRQRDDISQYDESFIESISFKDITSNQDLKELLNKLTRAKIVMTRHYNTLYNDYLNSINTYSGYKLECPDIDILRRYKNIAEVIQKAYSYVYYIYNYKNPFKTNKSLFMEI